MDREHFLTSGAEALKFVVELMEDGKFKAHPSPVQPGYLRALIPDTAPETGDSWTRALTDIQHVFPGAHPNGNVRHITSYPSIIGSMLTDALQILPSTWESCQCGTELEVMMLDWLGKMLHLPSKFLTDSGDGGGGTLNASGSMNTLLALLAARSLSIRRHKSSQPDAEDHDAVSKMVAYSSEEAHPALEKAVLISMIKLRKLESDEDFSMSGPNLRKAITEDRARGLIPTFVCATLGTTGPCSFDSLAEIGPICEAEDVWLNVDAGYAGNYFICPEFRPLLNGVQFARSVVVNPHESMRVSLGCSAMWVSDRQLMEDTFKSFATYLNPQRQDSGGMPDYRNLQFDLTRQCRSLKLWLVLRMHGVKELQELARRDVLLAKQFEQLVRLDNRFEIIGEVVLGVVCFRLKMCNHTNRQLLNAINKQRRICLEPRMSKGIFYLSISIKSSETGNDDIECVWRTIQDATDNLLHVKQ